MMVPQTTLMWSPLIGERLHVLFVGLGTARDQSSETKSRTMQLKVISIYVLYCA